MPPPRGTASSPATGQGGEHPQGRVGRKNPSYDDAHVRRPPTCRRRSADRGPGLALAAPRPASAQAETPPRPDQAAGTIRGSVVDERTEQPLARVLVRLADTEYRATTGTDGRFELRGVTPGDYTVTVSVVGYALLRKPVSATPGATLEFTFVLTAGTGTYEEKVDVVAPVFEQREPGSVAEQTIGATEIQDLRGLVADDPLRAIQAMPGVTATDDFSAEFSARGAGPRNTAVLLDGIPASAVLLHTVEGRDDSGSIARISSDVLSRATLMLGSYPQRTGDRLGPQLEFLTRDGSRDGFHLRAMVSMIGGGRRRRGPDRGRSRFVAGVDPPELPGLDHPAALPRLQQLHGLHRRVRPGRVRRVGAASGVADAARRPLALRGSGHRDLPQRARRRAEPRRPRHPRPALDGPDLEPEPARVRAGQHLSEHAARRPRRSARAGTSMRGTGWTSRARSARA